MWQQFKLAGIVLLIGLAVVLLLAVMSDYASGGERYSAEVAKCRSAHRERGGIRPTLGHRPRDAGATAGPRGLYTVTRCTVIESERPIGLLVLQGGIGVLNDSQRSSAVLARRISEGASEAGITSTLRIDGRPAPGIRGMARAGWRLLGFLLWNADGSIERITDLQFRGRSVRIVDAVSNGRIWVRVVVGPPLGDPRVKFASMELTADEQNVERLHGLGATRIRLSCSAIIDAPGCRLSRRICEGRAGPELASRVNRLTAKTRRVVLAGRRETAAHVDAGRERLMDSVIAEFLERVCR